jgi:hypothetical protein
VTVQTLETIQHGLCRAATSAVLTQTPKTKQYM